MTGKALIGCTVIVSSARNRFMRVMQARRGRPLISALHEPHLPALQFQRTARSLASRAWMRWITSRTTIPGSTSTLYSTKRPPRASPRQIRNVRSDMGPLELLDLRVGHRRQLLGRRGTFDGARLHPLRALADHHVDLEPLVALARVVDAGVGAPALLPRQRRARDHLPGDQQRAQVDRLMPPGVVLRGAVRLDARRVGLQPLELDEGRLQLL